MEKELGKKTTKNKKNSLFDGTTNPFAKENQIKKPEKLEEPKKKHKRSNSNIDEFAFDNIKEADLDEKLHNFMTNYDGKRIF